MPTDSVANRSFAELFTGPVRYVIPFFQRGYAWERRQWDDLFRDIQEQVFAEMDAETPLEEIEHFFGPMVVQERPLDEEGTAEFLVIDGQQRITTVYLLLALIMEHLLMKTGAGMQGIDNALYLRSLLTNAENAKEDDYLRLKVFSSKGDRLPTFRAVFGDDRTPKSAFYETDIRLFSPGKNKVEEFRTYATRKFRVHFNDIPSLWRLAQALLHCLKVVWIPLKEGKDDAQAIFESLNDKGMPLSASELLCSYLFKPMMGSADFETLHNEQWLSAIQICGGRSNFEEYLRYLFSIGQRKMVGPGRKAYIHFKNKHRPLDANAARRHLEIIHESAPLYQKISDPNRNRHPNPRVKDLLQAIEATRIDSCMPFLIATLRANSQGTLRDEDAVRLIRETLVLLVRRKVAAKSTTVYDQLFPNLFARVQNEPNKVSAIHELFRQRLNVWVSDQEFEEAFVKKAIDSATEAAFARMLLLELERRLSSGSDSGSLQIIEHVIPQQLDRNWKEYLGADALEDDLSMAVHTVGNLCLVPRTVQPGPGADPFVAKQAVYSDASALQRQIKEHEGPWNLAAVRARSLSLGRLASEIWAWGRE